MVVDAAGTWMADDSGDSADVPAAVVTVYAYPSQEPSLDTVNLGTEMLPPFGLWRWEVTAVPPKEPLLPIHGPDHSAQAGVRLGSFHS